MTVRRNGSELRALTIAAAFLAPIFLAGCATPYTQLEWGTKRPTYHASVRPRPRPHYDYRRYAYDDVPVPTARPSRPAWYQQPAPRPDYNDHQYSNYSGPVQFAWPVRGRVIEEFGANAEGQRNDGINIAANYGDPIRAAADGTVSYSGNDLRSYGNLALLRHDNGYVTAYAHAERFIVQKGDHVTRGQIIGYVGSTGDVRAPQLHFELRRGARDPIDPRSMLDSQQLASRY